MHQTIINSSRVSTENFKIVMISSQLTNYSFLEKMFLQTNRYDLSGCYNSSNYEDIQQQEIDIILFELNLNDKHCHCYYNNVRKKYPRTLSVIVSTSIDLNVLKAGIKLQVDAILSKNNLTNELYPCLNAITENHQKYIDPIFHDLIIEKFTGWESRNDKGIIINLDCLSDRESEILEMLHQMDSLEISENLFISEKTVRSHYRNIMQKLDVSSIKKLRLISYQIHLNE